MLLLSMMISDLGERITKVSQSERTLKDETGSEEAMIKLMIDFNDIVGERNSFPERNSRWL